MSPLSALRPGHWIAIGLIAVLVGSGALSKGFGLLGGDTSQAQRLTTCLDHHGISVTSLATAVGNPAVLLGGAQVVDQAGVIRSQFGEDRDHHAAQLVLAA